MDDEKNLNARPETEEKTVQEQASDNGISEKEEAVFAARDAEETAAENSESPESDGAREAVFEESRESDSDDTRKSAAGGSGKKAKRQRKKWTKKKKITVWSIVAAVLVVVIIASSLTVKFVVFNDEVYAVDLEQVKAGAPIFSDDFNGTELDRNRWLVDLSWDAQGNPGYRRGGYWTESAVSVKDGSAVISTFKEGDRWVTGSINSSKGEGREGFEHTYGYYETRCKLPKGYGIWSAFWLMPTGSLFGDATSRDASQFGAEIDVFEVPIWPQSRVQQAVHVGGYEKLHTSTFNPRWLTFDKHGDIYEEYHTYGLYWDQNIYKFYIDGKCFWTTSYNHNVSKVDEYMIFSVEIGGDKGLPNDSPWKWIGGKLITSNPEGDYYKSEFMIDYVKVWDVPGATA